VRRDPLRGKLWDPYFVKHLVYMVSCSGSDNYLSLPNNFPSGRLTSTRLSVQEQLEPSELFLQDLLGTGAQAEVYRAIWWRSFARCTSFITVAVKRFNVGSGERSRHCESLTHSISHPNLVKCFEATTKPPFLIVSEFCAGGSLFDIIHDSTVQITWSQRLKILLDVAKGMEYLHSQSPIIVHRDLKSCNVLLTKALTSTKQQPHAKVADFGLSRLLEPSVSPSMMMTKCVGTWRWMAPEVFFSTDYDERIDVFSFGLLLFEVLTREVPYADKWPVNGLAVNPRIGFIIINGHRPNINLVEAGCPTNVVALMEQCWDGDPCCRPAFPSVRWQLQNLFDLVMLYNKVKVDSQDGMWAIRNTTADL